MTSTWKAVLGVILIFIFGFAAGVVCSSIYAKRKMVEFLKHPAVAVSAALEKRLTHNLDLDPDQKRQIHDLFLQNLDQRKEVQKQIQPQVQALNRTTFMEINSVLRPDQRELFHDNLMQLRKRFSQVAPGSDAENQIRAVVQPAEPATNSGAAAPPNP